MIHDREDHRDRHETGRHDSHGSGQKPVQPVDQVRRVACPEHEQGDEHHARPVVDPVDRVPRLPDPFVGQRCRIDSRPDPDLPGRVPDPDEVRRRSFLEPGTEERIDQATRRRRADVADREPRGGDQLTRDLEPRIPVEDVVVDAGREHREHPERDRERDDRIVGDDPVAAATEERERVAREDGRDHAEEDRGTTEIRDRIGVHLPTTVRMIDDVELHGQPSDQRHRQQGDDECDQEDRQKRVEQPHRGGREREFLREIGVDQQTPEFEEHALRIGVGHGGEPGWRHASPLPAARLDAMSSIVRSRSISGSNSIADRTRVRSGCRIRRSSKPESKTSS